MRIRLAVTVLASVALLGCDDQGELGSAGVGHGFVTDARTDPDLMRADPDVVQPGAAIDAVFPRGSTRGPGFVLEQATSGSWEWHYTISSDTDAPDEAHTFTAQEFVAQDIAWVGGPSFESTKPHLIPVPDEAEPGLWRVCTAPDTPSLCAEFEITSDGS